MVVHHKKQMEAFLHSIYQSINLSLKEEEESQAENITTYLSETLLKGVNALPKLKNLKLHHWK
jgi:hypothetical protein